MPVAHLLAQVSAVFTVNAPASNCNPAIYSFTNNSTGAGTLSYEWNFGVYAGVNSVFQNPATTYLGCGTFTVKLIVTNSLGQKDSTTQVVNIRCSPQAAFSAGSLSGCVPFSTSFNSTSNPGSGTITNYLWDFGDGNSGNGSNPTHTYTEGGCKNITLIVTNTYNCSNTLTLNNVVCANAQPAAHFTSSTATSCTAPFNVTYAATADSGVAPYSYQWIFQGGTPATSSVTNPTVTYNNTGSFTTTLVVTDANGCTDTLRRNGYINIAPDTIGITLSAAHGCAPDTIALSGIATSAPRSWAWNATPSGNIFNTALQNTKVAFAASGTYNICLNASFNTGCVLQKCTTVVIYPKPVANYTYTGNLNTCIKPDPITFTNASTGTGLTYAWNFPGGRPNNASTAIPPTINYDSCGNFGASLKVTDANGCVATYSTPSFLAVTCPVASFVATPAYGCTPLTVGFNSSTSTGNPISWAWDFGDPGSGSSNTSNLPNPGHTYNTPGCYTPTLTTTNALGCTATFSFLNGVCNGHKPHANFSANPPMNCVQQPVYFTDSSTGTYAYTDYVWNFHGVPGADESSLQNPSFIYSDTGYATISLVVSNYGCADTITKDDYVYIEGPVSIPHAVTSCSNLQVSLDGTRSIDAQHYTWVIPGANPNFATTPTLTVTYPGPGTYTASLLVTNDSTGCQNLLPITYQLGNLQANFTGVPQNGCAPLYFCTQNTSVGVARYQWQTTDSAGNVLAVDAAASPCFNYPNPSTYSVRLIVTDTTGCTDTLLRKNYVHVYRPVPDIVAVPTHGCTPLFVNFNQTPGSIDPTTSEWNWSFGDPNSGINDSAFTATPTHVYNNTGVYTVSLKIVDSAGCTGSVTKQQYIQTSYLHAAFNVAYNNSCQGSYACFTTDSTLTGITYAWNFGDGGTSALPNPCHNYTVGGTYTIQLVMSNALGCSDTATAVNVVNVTRPHAALVADTTASTCPPLQVSFTNQSVGTDAQSTYFWMFGDGQVSTVANPVHIYNVGGYFDVTLVVTNANGCKDTLKMPAYIHIGGPAPLFVAPPSSGCAPYNICFDASASTNTATYTWNFGDGNVQNGADTICYTYMRTGTFYPELILNDGAGCVFSMPLGTVSVTGAVANFNLDNNLLCKNGIVHFTDSSYGGSPIISYNWNFGDAASGNQNTSNNANPSHYYGAAGVYIDSLTITTLDGCISSTTKTVAVVTPPVVDFVFNAPSYCTGKTVQFTNQSTSTAPIQTINWNFGDATSGASNTDSVLNPSHIYSSAGMFNINLVERDTNGCADTATKSITVYQMPTAVFTAHDTCINRQPIVFNNQSLNAVSYSWQFGDGTNSTQTSPVYIYADSGLYNVQLIAVNSVCADTATSAVRIYALPHAVFTIPATSACGVPATIITQNTSTTANYLWNFGDAASGVNDTSTAVNPVHTYNAGGTYAVKLVANANGCVDSTTASVTLTAKPVADFNAYDTCINTQPIAFTNTSQTANAYQWLFGDGNISQQATTQHTFADTGIYEVKLIAFNNSCTDTLTKSVQIYALPQANFNVANVDVCGVPANITMQNASTGATSYNWDFGDAQSGANNTSALLNPAHSFNTAGVYTIALTVIANGCSANTSQTISITQKPVASFAAYDTCINTQPIVFSNTSVNATSYEWNFGDGDNSNQNAPTHTFADSGQYAIQLIVHNAYCTDTATRPLKIFALPHAAFTLPFTSTCGLPITVAMQNISVGATSYSWNFGDPLSTSNTSQFYNAVHGYSNPGVYTVHLKVVSNGCIDSTSANFTLNPRPIASFVAYDTCINTQPIIFNNTSQGGNYYAWDFGDANSSAQPNPSHSYADTGIYHVKLVVTNATCADTVNQVVQIFPLPVAAFNIPATSTCVVPFSLALENLSTGAVGYNWDLGNSTYSQLTSPVAVYNSPGSYRIRLQAQSIYTCVDTSTSSFTVFPVPVLRNMDIEPANGCAPQAVSFDANVVNGNNYTWNFGDNTASINSSTGSASHTFNTPGTYTLSLYITSANGCADTVIFADTVKVHEVPKAAFDFTTNITADPVNGTVDFTNTSNNATGYTWNFGDGETSSELNPTHMFQQAGNFDVLLIAYTQYGCADSVLKSIEVIKKSLFVPNAFAPDFNNGNGLVKVWKPAGEGLQTYHAQIFNTYGELLWESTALTEDKKPAEGWDGTYQGQPCHQDVYVWKIDAMFTDGSHWEGMSYSKGGPRKTVGDVTLIR